MMDEIDKQVAEIMQRAAEVVESPMLAAALRYVERGWPVLQVLPNKKRKILGDGVSTLDPERIRAMWQEHPYANVAIDLKKSGLVAIEAADSEGVVLKRLGLETETLSLWGCGYAMRFYHAPEEEIANQRLSKTIVLYADFVVVPPSESAMRSGERIQGCALGWNDTDAAIVPLPARLTELRIAAFNEDHFVVLAGKTTAIARPAIDPTLGRENLVLHRPVEMTAFYANLPPIEVVNGDKKRVVPFVDYWMRHPERRTYNGLVFEPEKRVPEGYYNLWRGFTVEPREGDCSLYLALLRDVICSGDEDLYRWFIGWMAQAVQHPGKRPGTSPVLRGGQGVGKGTAINEYGKLFGQHYIHISSSKHLVGNFNSHMKDALLVFADEAVWAGDRAGEGVLKGLVTEDTIVIEGKFQDAYAIRNHVRLMLASNKNWVVPAGLDERRFCVIDVSDIHQQDTKYFGAIVEQMENGGRAALLHHLSNLDISDVDLRRIPASAALNEQKLFSMTPLESWWLSKLQEGSMDGAKRDNTDDWYVHPPRLHSEFVKAARERGLAHLPSLESFAHEVKKMAPGLDATRKYFGGKQRRCWVLPSLSKCRESFPHANFDEEEDDDWAWQIYDPV